MKIIAGGLLVLIGVLVLFWGHPVHGHLQLGDDPPKYILILTLLIICWGLPMFWVVNGLFHRRKN